MYAIVQAGGRQHKVTPGGFVTVDGTAGEPGAELTFDQVLLVEKDGGEVVAGAPFVANARITGRRRRREPRAEDPRVQEETPQGDAPDEGPSRDLHARQNQRDSSLDRIEQWLIKKVKAAHATGAIPIRSVSA